MEVVTVVRVHQPVKMQEISFDLPFPKQWVMARSVFVEHCDVTAKLTFDPQILNSLSPSPAKCLCQM